MENFLVVSDLPFIPSDAIENSPCTISLNGDLEELKNNNSVIILHQLGRELFGATIGKICYGYEHRESGDMCNIVIANGFPKFKINKSLTLKEKDGIRYTMYTMSKDCLGSTANWLY